MGGCVTDRRQDAGAAAPSGGLEDGAAAERTPALRQRPCPRAGREPAGEVGGETWARPGVVPDLRRRRGSGVGTCGSSSGCFVKFVAVTLVLTLPSSGSSFLRGALRPWVKAKDKIADTTCVASLLLANLCFRFSAPLLLISAKEKVKNQKKE